MNEQCKKMENFGKAIGNATRYSIVQELAQGKQAVGQLVRAVGCSQSAMSQHLKVLKLSDIVIDERNGQEVYYSLNTAHMLGVLKLLTGDIKSTVKKS
jgi:DNA-binding transcriptional ArsR family regulator